MSNQEGSTPPGAHVTLRFESMRELIARLAPWLGADGVFVASDSPLPEGSRVDFELKVRDQLKLLHGTAEVAWARREPGGGGEPSGMALRFVDVDSAGRRFVERLVENHRRGGGVTFDVDGSRPAGSRLAELTEVVPEPRREPGGAEAPAAEEVEAAPAETGPRGEGPEPASAAPESPPAEPAVFPVGPAPRQEAFPSSFLDEVEAEIRAEPPAPPDARPDFEEEPEGELDLEPPPTLETGEVAPEAGDLGDEGPTLEAGPAAEAEEREEWPGAPAADEEIEAGPTPLRPDGEEPAEGGAAAEVAGEEEAPGVEEPHEESSPPKPEPARPRRRDLLSLPDLPPVAPVIDRPPPPRETSPPLRAEVFEPTDEPRPATPPEITPGAQFAEARGARRTWAVLLFSLLTVGVLAALFLLGDRLIQIWRQGGVEAVATPVEEAAAPLQRRPPATRPPADAPASGPAAPAPGPPALEPEGPAAGPAGGERSPAAAAGEAAEVGDDQESGAGDATASRIETIVWEQLGAKTVVTVGADRPIRPRDVQTFRLDGANPREVVKIAGIREPLDRPARTVDTPQVTRIRSGLHELPEGTELHLVFDLAGPGIQLEGQGREQGRLRLVFGPGETP